MSEPSPEPPDIDELVRETLELLTLRPGDGGTWVGDAPDWSDRHLPGPTARGTRRTACGSASRARSRTTCTPS